MTIQGLAWMNGTWRCQIWDGTFEEVWSTPENGAMIGMGRHLVGEKTTFMEFLSIEEADGKITMWILLGRASKGPKTPKPFDLTSLTSEEAVFENPENPYPSRIAYTVAGENEMRCRISGTENGVTKHDDFDFKRFA